MKCELCHKREAQTALIGEKDGVEDELYVCNECARQERVRRQKKSQRTRKTTGLPPGVSISVAGVSGDGEPPPQIIGAFLNAVQDMVNGLGNVAEEAGSGKRKTPEFREFPCGRSAAEFRIGGGLHLEGLHLIGELEAVQRAMRAMRMQLKGIEADGVKDAGHVYRLRYQGPIADARRAVEDLLAQERNARVRLFEEMPRVFGDTLCRSLAILKNCRLLSPGELFDLLSPMRLAAMEELLDGIGLEEIERMLAEIELDNGEDKLSPEERDRVDAGRADTMNARFEDVVLNERAEEKFL